MIIREIQHPTLKQLTTLDDECRKLASAYSRNEDEDLVLDRLETIENLWSDLEEEIPSSDSKNFFARHLHFTRYWIKNGNREKCASDVNSLTSKDIPGIRKTLEEATSIPNYHPRIMERVFPPVKRQEFDSAVRRAFSALKAFLTKQYSVSTDLDGEALFNACFGSRGAAQDQLSDTERQAIRNYLSGIYVLHRNTYAHNDLDSEWSEAAAIIAGINSIMIRLDDVDVGDED